MERRGRGEHLRGETIDVAANAVVDLGHRDQLLGRGPRLRVGRVREPRRRAAEPGEQVRERMLGRPLGRLARRGRDHGGPVAEREREAAPLAAFMWRALGARRREHGADRAAVDERGADVDVVGRRRLGAARAVPRGERRGAAAERGGEAERVGAGHREGEERVVEHGRGHPERRAAGGVLRPARLQQLRAEGRLADAAQPLGESGLVREEAHRAHRREVGPRRDRVGRPEARGQPARPPRARRAQRQQLRERRRRGRRAAQDDVGDEDRPVEAGEERQLVDLAGPAVRRLRELAAVAGGEPLHERVEPLRIGERHHDPELQQALRAAQRPPERRRGIDAERLEARRVEHVDAVGKPEQAAQERGPPTTEAGDRADDRERARAPHDRGVRGQRARGVVAGQRRAAEEERRDERGAAQAAPRGACSAIHCALSSRLRILPVGLRGSSSTNTTLRGRL